MTVKDYLATIKVKKGGFGFRWRSITNRVELVPQQFDPDKKEMLVHLCATDCDPVPSRAGGMNEINIELSYLNVAQDAMRKHAKNFCPLIKQITTTTDHPGIKGDRDYLRSKMKHLRKVTVPEFNIKVMNDIYARQNLPLLDKSKLPIEQDKHGVKKYVMESGEIENNSPTIGK